MKKKQKDSRDENFGWDTENMGLPDPNGRPQEEWPVGSPEEGAQQFITEFTKPLAEHALLIDSIWSDMDQRIAVRKHIKAARLNEYPAFWVPRDVLAQDDHGDLLVTGIPEGADCYFRIAEFVHGTGLIRPDESPGMGLAMTWYHREAPKTLENYEWSTRARSGKKSKAVQSGTGGTQAYWPQDRLLGHPGDILTSAARNLAQTGLVPEAYNPSEAEHDDPEVTESLQAQLPPSRVRA